MPAALQVFLRTAGARVEQTLKAALADPSRRGGDLYARLDAPRDA